MLAEYLVILQMLMIIKRKKDNLMFLKIYNVLITILYPLVIKGYINKRKQIGKEDVARFNERIGKPKLPRPEGKLFWLHGASVGESVSMLPLINKILETYIILQLGVFCFFVKKLKIYFRFYLSFF